MTEEEERQFTTLVYLSVIVALGIAAAMIVWKTYRFLAGQGWGGYLE